MTSHQSIFFSFYLTSVAAAGIEDKQRFNFCLAASDAAKIWPQTAAAATKNHQNRQSAEKVTQNTWPAQKCIQKAWQAKFNLRKPYQRANLTLNTLQVLQVL